MGTGSSPGVKCGRGVTLTPHSLLVPWSRKSRAIPLVHRWAVRPLQSLSALQVCTLPYLTCFDLPKEFLRFTVGPRKMLWKKYMRNSKTDGRTHIKIPIFKNFTYWYDIFVKRQLGSHTVAVVQYTFTHTHTHTQTHTHTHTHADTIHRTTQNFWNSACHVPSLRVLPWHFPYNWRKNTEKPQSG